MWRTKQTQWEFQPEKSQAAVAEHNLTTSTGDKVKKKPGDLGWGGGRRMEGERKGREEGRRGREEREGGNISGQSPALTLRRSYEFLFLLLFLFCKLLLLCVFLLTFSSKKNALKITQHFICALLGRFLWRFKLFIARNKILSLWKSSPSLRKKWGGFFWCFFF